MNKKKIEKAIEELKSYIEIWELEQADFDLEVILYKETIESMKVAIQALEKQVPKRAEFAGGRYICRCGWDIYREEQCYCWSCGQALDWSGEDE